MKRNAQKEKEAQQKTATKEKREEKESNPSQNPTRIIDKREREENDSRKVSSFLLDGKAKQQLEQQPHFPGFPDFLIAIARVGISRFLDFGKFN